MLPAYHRKIRELMRRCHKALRTLKAISENRKAPQPATMGAFRAWLAAQRELNLLAGEPEDRVWTEGQLTGEPAEPDAWERVLAHIVRGTDAGLHGGSEAG